MIINYTQIFAVAGEKHFAGSQMDPAANDIAASKFWPFHRQFGAVLPNIATEAVTTCVSPLSGVIIQDTLVDWELSVGQPNGKIGTENMGRNKEPNEKAMNKEHKTKNINILKMLKEYLSV